MNDLSNSHPYLQHGEDADGIRGIAMRFYDNRAPIPGKKTSRSNNDLGDMRNLRTSLIIGFSQAAEILLLWISDRQRQIIFRNRT